MHLAQRSKLRYDMVGRVAVEPSLLGFAITQRSKLRSTTWAVASP